MVVLGGILIGIDFLQVLAKINIQTESKNHGFLEKIGNVTMDMDHEA